MCFSKSTYVPVSQGVLSFSFQHLWGGSHYCLLQLEKLILMSRSGYHVVCSNKDFGILGILGVLRDLGFLGG